MKNLQIAGLVILAVISSSVSLYSSDIYYKLLFERGVFLMEAQANSKGAIPIFQEIVKRHPNDRRYAALSQFYLGICYKRMGSDLAHQAFLDVVRKFPDQADIVKTAKKEITELPEQGSTNKKTLEETKPIPLWKGKSVHGTETISQDGRYFTYVNLETGDLMLHDTSSGKTRRLTRTRSEDSLNEYAEKGVISPDSRQIAFGWQNNRGEGELRIVDIDGSGQRILLRDKDILHVHPVGWSSAEDKILACITRSDLSHKIVFFSASDGKTQTVKDMGLIWPDHMKLSPDGRYVSYGLLQNKENPERDLFLFDIEEKKEIPLIILPGDDLLLGWTKDGKNILYSNEQSGIIDAWLISLWEGKPRKTARKLKSDIEPCNPLGFTRSGDFYFSKKTTKKTNAGENSRTAEICVMKNFVPDKSRTIIVPDDFFSIQDAISAAKAWDTVYIRRGCYFEKITIGKSLTLQGEDRKSTILDGGGSGIVITISASHVIVNGITVTHGDIGVNISASDPIHHITIENSIITSNESAGILSRNSSGYHIIEENILSHNPGYALNVHQFSKSSIRNNDVFGNGAGLRFGWGWYIHVEGNNVFQNQSAGIYADSCYYSTIEKNLVYSNKKIGIKMGYISSRNTIRENIICENEEGIWIGLEGNESGDNRFYHNDIIKNQIQIGESRKGLSGFQKWYYDSVSGGNYWSGYSGRDRNNDGIGDTPYEFVTGTRDNFPLTMPSNKVRTILKIFPGLIIFSSYFLHFFTFL